MKFFLYVILLVSPLPLSAEGIDYKIRNLCLKSENYKDCMNSFNVYKDNENPPSQNLKTNRAVKLRVRPYIENME